MASEFHTAADGLAGVEQAPKGILAKKISLPLPACLS
jgi:hypothetical protein